MHKKSIKELKNIQACRCGSLFLYKCLQLFKDSVQISSPGQALHNIKLKSADHSKLQFEIYHDFHLNVWIIRFDRVLYILLSNGACAITVLQVMEQVNISYNLCVHTSWITVLLIQCSPVGVISAVSGARLVVDPPYICRLTVWRVWLSVPSNGSLYTRIPATLPRAGITFSHKNTHTHFYKWHDPACKFHMTLTFIVGGWLIRQKVSL